MLKRSWLFLLGYRSAAVTMLLAAALGLHAQIQLHVASAADLTPVLPKLAAEYAKATGVTLVPSFGSSATLTDQIRNGAPFDVFLSADASHPQQLAEAGLTTGTPVPYAHGVLVLWARKDSPAQPLSLGSLTKASVAKIAVANPLHAPYGLAAQQYLEHAGLIAQVKPKLVTAENIAQTAQFVESGNAQAGLISLTTASTPHFRELGSFVLVPVNTYAPLVQSGIVLKASSHASAAEAFLRWLTSDAVQGEMKGFGLEAAR